jgi:hypothetical protein
VEEEEEFKSLTDELYTLYHYGAAQRELNILEHAVAPLISRLESIPDHPERPGTSENRVNAELRVLGTFWVRKYGTRAAGSEGTRLRMSWLILHGVAFVACRVLTAQVVGSNWEECR